MGFFDELFGGKTTSQTRNRETTEASTTATTERSGESETEVNFLNSLVEAIRSAGTQETRRGPAGRDQYFRDLLQNIPRYMEDFTKESAVVDSQEAVNAAVTDVLNANIPGLNQLQTAAGGYNDTIQQILRGNVVASAAREGAKVRQQTIKDYSDINESAIRAIQGILQLEQQSQESTRTTETGERTSDERQTGAERTTTEETATVEEDQFIDTIGRGDTVNRDRSSGLIGKFASGFINDIFN